MEKFYFDTLFSATELSSLSPAFKYWQRIDVNGDNIPDLIFVGAFKGRDSESRSAEAYISKDGSYELVSLIRGDGTSSRPHVFIQKQNNQSLIIVHQYHFSGFKKQADLIRNRDLDSLTCDGDDTLIYKSGTVIDYVSQPSKVVFDSVRLVKKYGWHCDVDSFIIYNNGSGRYYGGCNTTLGSKSFQETSAGIDILKELVQSFDFEHCRKERYETMTDLDGARLEIYHNGKVEQFFDYGLRLSFTVKAIYKYFDDLKFGMRGAQGEWY